MVLRSLSNARSKELNEETKSVEQSQFIKAKSTIMEGETAGSQATALPKVLPTAQFVVRYAFLERGIKGASSC
jgi:hypothetical protein